MASMLPLLPSTLRGAMAEKPQKLAGNMRKLSD